MPSIDGPSIITQPLKVKKQRKSSLIVKLPIKIAHAMAQELVARSSHATAVPALAKARTNNASTWTINQMNSSTLEGSQANAERRQSQLLDIRERKIRAREEYLNSSKEEYDLLQQSSRDNHEEIMRLKAELARALQDNERQTAALDLSRQKTERQIQQQAIEIEYLKAQNVKYQGLKRKLAEALSEDEVVEGGVSTTKRPKFSPPTKGRAARTRKVSAKNISQVPSKFTAGSPSARPRSPAPGTLHNPWTVPDDGKTDDEADGMEETITVRVATKSEPESPSARITTKSIISSGVSKALVVAEGTESETEGSTGSGTQNEDDETAEESSSDPDNSQDSDWDPEFDNINYSGTWLPGVYA